MTDVPPSLTKQVDVKQDHLEGPEDAQVTLVQYHDYTCNHCRDVYSLLEQLRRNLGDQYVYVIRHFPRNERAQFAAELAEAADAQGKFWEMHDYLNGLDNIEKLTEDELIEQAASAVGLSADALRTAIEEEHHTAEVREDYETGIASGVQGVPTFFVNDVRYDGPWELSALENTIKRPLTTRLATLFGDFMRLEVSGGVLLMVATIIALLWANSPWSDSYFELWSTELSINLAGHELREDFLHWINDGLLVLFFLVVGLEIKRELLAGELSEKRKAILPLTGALGGMAVPAIIFVAFNLGGDAIDGWGIPVATDIAFMLGVLALVGSRIPSSLRVFITALAIGDDIGAVLIIALFYTSNIDWVALGIGAAIFVLLLALNRMKVYQPWPYAVLGIGLWLAIFVSGVHATIAGVLLGITIPAVIPVKMTAFLSEVTALLNTVETEGRVREDERAWLSDQRQAVAQELEVIAQRIESPLQRMERTLHPWTTYAIVPLFALANAGVAIPGNVLEALTTPVSLGILVGLVIGKPLGITLASWIVVRLGLADLPQNVQWKHLIAVSTLTGIGFTMSLFIANIGLAGNELLTDAKMSILLASLIAGVVGVGLSFAFGGTEEDPDEPAEDDVQPQAARTAS